MAQVDLAENLPKFPIFVATPRFNVNAFNAFQDDICRSPKHKLFYDKNLRFPLQAAHQHRQQQQQKQFPTMQPLRACERRQQFPQRVGGQADSGRFPLRTTWTFTTTTRTTSNIQQYQRAEGTQAVSQHVAFPLMAVNTRHFPTRSEKHQSQRNETVNNTNQISRNCTHESVTPFASSVQTDCSQQQQQQQQQHALLRDVQVQMALDYDDENNSNSNNNNNNNDNSNTHDNVFSARKNKAEQIHENWTLALEKRTTFDTLGLVMPHEGVGALTTIPQAINKKMLERQQQQQQQQQQPHGNIRETQNAETVDYNNERQTTTTTAAQETKPAAASILSGIGIFQQQEKCEDAEQGENTPTNNALITMATTTTTTTTTRTIAEIKYTKQASSEQQLLNEITATTTSTTSSSGRSSDLRDTSSQQVRALQQLVSVANLSTGTSSNFSESSLTTTTTTTTTERRDSDKSSKLLASDVDVGAIVDVVSIDGGGNSFALTTVIANKYDNNQQQIDEQTTTATTSSSAFATTTTATTNSRVCEMVVSKTSHEPDEQIAEEERLSVSVNAIDESVDPTIDEMKYEMHSNLANNMPSNKVNDVRRTSTSQAPLDLSAMMPTMQTTTTTTTATTKTTIPTTAQRSQSLDSFGANLDSVLPERTRLRRQRRMLSQSSKDQPEDPVERLNRLRARISGALSQVKGVLKQYSVDTETELTDNNTEALLQQQQQQQQQQAKDEASVENTLDAGPVSFRFVRKVRRRSVFNEADEEEEKKMQPLEMTTKAKQEAGNEGAYDTKVNKDTKREVIHDNGTEVKNGTETDVKIGNETEVNKGTKKGVIIDNGTEVKNGSKTDVKTGNQTEVERDTKSEVINDNGTEVKNGTETDVKIGNETEAEKDTKTGVINDNGTEVKNGTKTDVKTGNETEAEKDTKTEVINDNGTEVKNGTKTDVKIGNETEVEKETKGEVIIDNETKVKNGTDVKIGNEPEVKKDTKNKVSNDNGTAVKYKFETEEKNEKGTDLPTLVVQNVQQNVEAGAKSNDETETSTKSHQTKKRTVVMAKSKSTGAGRRASIAAVERSKIELPIKAPLMQGIKALRRPSDSEAILKKKVASGETKMPKIVHKVKQMKVNEIATAAATATATATATTTTIGSETGNNNNNNQMKENNHIVMRDDKNSNKDAALIAASDDDAARIATKLDEQSIAGKVAARLISPLQDGKTSGQVEAHREISIASIEQIGTESSSSGQVYKAIDSEAAKPAAPTTREELTTNDCVELLAGHSIAKPIDAVTTSKTVIMPELQALPAPVQVFNVPKDEFAKKRVVLKKTVRKNSNDKSVSSNKKAPSIAVAEPQSEQTEKQPELEPEAEVEPTPVPVQKPRKVKKKVIIKRQQRRLSISDTGFFREPAASENAEPIDDVETLEKAIAYVTDDDEQEQNQPSNANENTEPVTTVEEIVAPLKTCLKLREFQVGDWVMYAERYKKTLVRWKKGLVIERITSISYKLDIDGKEVPAHISYIKKYTDRKVNFGGKEYLEINYEQIEEEEMAARTYSIWNMV